MFTPRHIILVNISILGPLKTHPFAVWLHKNAFCINHLLMLPLCANLVFVQNTWFTLGRIFFVYISFLGPLKESLVNVALRGLKNSSLPPANKCVHKRPQLHLRQST